jgi:hypothetical protein
MIARATTGQRTSPTSKPYCTALLRIPTEADDAAIVSVIAFSASVCTALLAHGKGDSGANRGPREADERDADISS